MSENMHDYNYTSGLSIIKVIGVGGGGGNAVSHMYRHGIKGVEFYVTNTDIQALEISPVPNKIQLGKDLTEGLGAGANPERGREAALESKDELRQLLGNTTKMVFITAGMGGGTGTGAAPVIAEVAKNLGILTVGIVTAPFSFEGKPKRTRAQEGIAELREYCDTVLVILNDKLRDVYGRASMREAFRQADNVLLKAAKSIAEIITVSGNINVDFEDVRTVMQDAGAAVMGSATAEGENRARRAAEGAISSPLLNNTNIFGAKYILLSIVVGDDEDFQMDELEEITDYIQEQAGDDAEIIFGQAMDETLGDSISVTIIATGFENREDIPPTPPQRRVYDLSNNKRVVKNRVVTDTFEEKDFFDKQKAAEEKRILQENAANTFAKDEETDRLQEQKAPLNYQQQVPKNPPKQQPDKIIYDINEDYDEEKKKEIEDANYEHKAPLRQHSNHVQKSVSEMTNEEIQQKKEIPAYIRRNIKLDNKPQSTENTRSRYNVDEDNDLIGGNRFLHDNVD
ncbi:MAG: cell division protein FtsZ [Bernardetiaceae bacterium]|nr:cell division protein FtsZ [Bernardetiaceae bacterium]